MLIVPSGSLSPDGSSLGDVTLLPLTFTLSESLVANSIGMAGLRFRAGPFPDDCLEALVVLSG